MAVMEVAPPVGRPPRSRDFVRLKLVLMRNGFRGQVWRVVAFVVGLVVGLGLALGAFAALATSAAASPETGYSIAIFAGTITVLGWTFVPLLFFGVDETLDPARFALLPIRPGVLARGMLAAAFIGVPAIATALALAGLVVAAGIRFGLLAALVAFVGVASGLLLGVVASRAVTSAFAALLRSRRVRDFAAVLIAVLASSVAPMQWAAMAAVERGSLDQAQRVAAVLGWTPLGAPFALPYDVAGGAWGAALTRSAIVVATIALLIWWWSRTIESAMLGVTSGGQVKAGRIGSGAVAALVPVALRPFARGAFGAVLAREWRSWWRDPRRRASMTSILIASAVLPIALSLGGTTGAPSGFSGVGLSFAVTMAGTMGGMLLANQFAFDADAFAGHLLAAVPGRVELRARAAAIALVAVPVQVAVVVIVTVLVGSTQQVPIGLGILAASFGAAVACAAALSVLAPYSLPENTNPFAMSSGGGSAKGMLALVAMLGTLVLAAPVVVAGLLLGPERWWLVLAIGAAYGLALAWVGTLIAGDLLERRGPEVLVAVTPRR